MTSTWFFGLFFALIAWRVYRRIRRNIGRQRLHPVRAMFSILILSAVTALFALTSIGHPKVLLALAGGAAAGIGLGFVGLRLTRFESTAEGHFYTPNTPIGVSLSLLLTGRVLYRFWVNRDVMASSFDPNAAVGHAPPPLQSPLTFLIFGLTAGYYIVYQIGLYLHSRDKNRPAAPLNPAVSN
jgi:hypothetical protein